MAGLDLVQKLSTTNLSEVPSRFVQPLHRRQPACHGSAAIPIIDLHALLHQDPHSADVEAQALTRACEEWGFFQVINHGISTSLMDDVRRVVREFLDLPMEEKMKRPMMKRRNGHIPAGYGRFSEDAPIEWVDGLLHYLSPPALKDPGYWPDKPAAYRETIDAYGNEVIKLVNTLFGNLSKSLGLEDSELAEAFGGNEAQAIFRVNYYPRCQQPDLVLGRRPHSDASALTVLLHDEVEGLQVKKHGTWWAVKPLPNALIVNVGDMMELVSNGRYRSMEHRAVVSSETDRTSIVVFYLPRHDTNVGPLAAKGIEQHNAIYKSVKYGDYFATSMNKELQGKDIINSLRI